MKKEYKIKSKKSNINELIVKAPLILTIFRLMRFLQTPNEQHQNTLIMPPRMMPGDSLDEWMSDRIDEEVPSTSALTFPQNEG